MRLSKIALIKQRDPSWSLWLSDARDGGGGSVGCASAGGRVARLDGEDGRVGTSGEGAHEQLHACQGRVQVASGRERGYVCLTEYNVSWVAGLKLGFGTSCLVPSIAKTI